MCHWGLLYRLEGDRKWLDRAYPEMVAVSAFPDWNPSQRAMRRVRTDFEDAVKRERKD